MIDTLSTILNKTLKNFTFRQRFLFFAMIFILCLPFPFYWLIEGQNLYIESADYFLHLWENKKNESRNFKEEDLFTERFLEKLRIETQDGPVNVNLFPENQTINSLLYELYRISASMARLYLLDIGKENTKDNYNKQFDLYLFSLIEDINNIKNKLNSDIKSQLLINKIELPNKQYITFYINNLTNILNNIKTHSISQFQVSELLNENKKIVDSLITFGISYNQSNKTWHQLIRNVCIVSILIALSTVFFYIFFHVLTSHFLELENHIKALSKGKFKKCFCSDAEDEFGEVGKAFDTMAQTIQPVVGELQHLGRKLTESIKQVGQSTTEQNKSFLEDENKIKEAEDYTNTITSRTQILAKLMNELSIGFQQNTMSQTAKNTLEKMRLMISSLTTRSANILQHLINLKNRLESNNELFIFLYNVSNQASLLSLNSAIVTANIINNKQSFIKISSEIKRFADKTALSSFDIQKIVKGIILRVDNICNDANRFLNELNESIEKLKKIEKHLSQMTIQAKDQTEKFQRVNKIMQRQAQIAEELKKNLNNLSTVSHENRVQNDAVLQTIKELSQTAERLQIVLNQFFRPKHNQKKLLRLQKDESKILT